VSWSLPCSNEGIIILLKEALEDDIHFRILEGHFEILEQMREKEKIN
jgi:hypothetical protein